MAGPIVRYGSATLRSRLLIDGPSGLSFGLNPLEHSSHVV